MTSTREIPQNPRSHRRAVATSVVVGTALEWFDMFLYASMASVVFAPVFFPSVDPRVGAVSSLATFAVGYLARPVGAILLGPVADRHGRRTALAITFILMGVGTFLIGTIPGYDVIGIWAPILLVLLRLLQGLGAGAEQGTAFITAYEHAARGKRGIFGSLPALGVNIGLFASSIVVAAITAMSREDLLSWGWRIPFIASGVLVVIGWWVRSHMPESPVYEREVDQKQPRSFGRWIAEMARLCTEHWRGLLTVTLVTVGYNAITYMYKTFGQSYLAEFRQEPAWIGAVGVALAAVVGIVMVPASGWLADRYSVRLTLSLGAGLTVLMAFPYFWFLDSGRAGFIWAGLIIGTGFAAPLIFASFGEFLSRQFPPEVRSTGVSIREIAGAVSGGFVPVWALAIVTVSNGTATWGVSLLFIAAALCVFAALATDHLRAEKSPNTRTSTTKETVR